VRVDHEVNPRVDRLLPAPPPGQETDGMSGDRVSATPRAAWRPWTVWLACGLAVAWSGLLVVADELAAVMGSWDTPAPGLHWLGVGAAGEGVLAVGMVGVLAAGVTRPRWRRRAVITAWTMITLAFGWFVLTGQLS
jgi:hypothetical protein